MKFGIGQPMRRHEDLRLITGRGRYTDDIIPTANDACLRAALARGARAYQTHRRSRGAAHAWRAICGYCRVAIEAGHPTPAPAHLGDRTMEWKLSPERADTAFRLSSEC